MSEEIKLGDKVKCIHTGFVGIAVARTEFINGCVQIEIVPKVSKGEKYPEAVSLDEGSLEVIIKKKPKKKKKDDDGGPTRLGNKIRGY